MEEMPDKENEPLAANAPAPEAPAPEAPATDAPPAGAPAIDTTPVGASATEATDAGPTAATKPLTKKQKQKIERERMRAKAPKPIKTPVNKIVAVNPEKNVPHAGMVGRVRVDNSHKKSGKVEILNSNGDDKWFSPGMLVEVDQKDKDAFEAKEKESGGKPYYLGDDDDASESDGGDEPLAEPPVAKDETVKTLSYNKVNKLLWHVDGSRDARGREQKARDFAAVLADTSAKKADERAALIASIDATLKNAWAKYEKHRADHPGLYPEVEPEVAPKDYSDVPIDHVKVPDWVKEKFRNIIQECVDERADLSSVEAKPSSHIQKSDFLKALRDARGESLEQQQSQRLAREEAPALPTISRPGESVVYSSSIVTHVIKDVMVGDSRTLVRDRTLVPAVGERGGALRGGFHHVLGRGAPFNIVGILGPASFRSRWPWADGAEDRPDDAVEAMGYSIREDLKPCFVPEEWDDLEPRLVYAGKLALGALPDSATEKQKAEAVFGAYHRTVEEHEHEAVWKSTFKAPGLFHTG